MEEMWELCSDYLSLLHHGFSFRIHAFVLMSNHYHLIVSTPLSNLPEGMNHFQREVSRYISRASGRINQTWGRPYYPCLLDSNHYFFNAYKYLYRNPVEAGLATSVETYRYSTLFRLLGFGPLSFPLEFDTLLFNPNLDLEHLAWLNTGSSDDFIEVGKALARKKFHFQKTNHSRKYVRPADFVF